MSGSIPSVSSPAAPAAASPAPYQRPRKLPKPDKDSFTRSQKNYHDEKSLWKSFLTFLIANFSLVRWFFKSRWLSSIEKTGLTLEQMHQIKIPKYYPDDLKEACADELAERIVQALEVKRFPSVANISTLCFPKLSYSQKAEKRIITALIDSIRKARQHELISLGWGKAQDLSLEAPKIAKLFIDALIQSNPSHKHLTLESLPENAGDLVRLIQSFQSIETLCLSTSIESELTEDFVKALPNLETITFTAPDNLKLKESTWNHFDDYLNEESLEVKFEGNVPRPTGKRDWMKKLK